jgi:hypothetical protein
MSSLPRLFGGSGKLSGKASCGKALRCGKPPARRHGPGDRSGRKFPAMTAPYFRALFPLAGRWRNSFSPIPVVAKIIISYRRSDADMFAGRVRDRIASRFGENSVFIDVDNIPLGKDFRVHIQEEMAQADAVLVIIGTKWLGSVKGGRSRIQDETDPVRIEVETALGKKIPTIPLLVGTARMPKSEQLPDSLRDFSFINAASVDTGRDFHRDLDRVIAAISDILDRPSSQAERPAPAPDLAARAETAAQIATAAKDAAADRADAKTESAAASARDTAAGSDPPSDRRPADLVGLPTYAAAAESPGKTLSSRPSRPLVAAVVVGGVLAVGLAWAFLRPAHEPPAVAPIVQPSQPSPVANAAGQGPQNNVAAPSQPSYGTAPSQPSYGAGAADPGAAVVSKFYQYLSAGDGDDAAKLIVPEKRTGNFSPQKMTQFYSSVRLQIVSITPYGGNAYRVTYTYQSESKNAYQPGNVCNDTVTVTVTQRAGQYLIQRIDAPGC